MAYRVVNVPWDDAAAWGAQLHETLASQESEGYTLSAMTPRTVALPHPTGPGGPTRYVVQLVCVFHREGGETI